MAAPNACDASVLVVSAVWGTSALGICTGIAFECTVQDVVVRGEGVTGPTCPAAVVTDLVAVVDFLVGPPIDPIENKDTAASLVFTSTAVNGSKTDTLASMIPKGFSSSMDRDNPPKKWRQTFRHKGSMASNPVS
jgi:hypothetical protein